MESRIVIVPSDAPLLHHRTTRRLHTYPDGSVLVETAAPATEAGTADEMPVRRGLQLPALRTPVKVTAEAAWAADMDDQPLLAYVELIGPVDAAWVAALQAYGLTPLQYQPENAYLCQGTADGFIAAQRLDFVLSVTPLTDEIKPGIERLLEGGTMEVTIVAQAQPNEMAALLAELRALDGVTIQNRVPVERAGNALYIAADVTTEGHAAVLANPRVVAIERRERARPEDEVADLIVVGQYSRAGEPQGSYLRWLEDQGLSGAGVTVGVVDAGVDTQHVAFDGRIRDLAGITPSWHGTFVAGHVAGCYLREQDSHKFIYGVGVAPKADILVQDNAGTPAALCRQTVTTAGPAGQPGSVQNNSWGKGLRDPMNYGAEEAMYDRLVRNADPDGPLPLPLTICFSSGNSGRQGLTRPKSAKNIIVTGNSENYRPDVGGIDSDNIRAVYSGTNASSWGNCGDGRIRPHVVAPGQWTASANYDSHPGQPEYISPLLTWGSGSSAASPKTAGVCALLIEWWRRHNQAHPPSPAMLRALIINGAEPIESGGFIPNQVQGWGRLCLGNIVAENVAHVYVDQEHMLTHYGDERAWNVAIADPRQPVRITLAWTDPSGPIGSGSTPASSPIVNRLALRVETNGQLYRGNQFQNGWSYADSPADSEGWDNLQNIYLAPGTAGARLRVVVATLNITTDCLSNMPGQPRQDFALVISNGHIDATAPTDIFVNLDKAADAPPPDEPDGYWQSYPDDSDSAESDPPSETDDDQTTDDTDSDYNWWGGSAIGFARGEGGRVPAPVDMASLTRNLSAGVDLLTVGGSHRVISAGTAPESSSDPAPNEYAQDLAVVLAWMRRAWDDGAGTGSQLTSGRRTAVLVVGGGTRVSRADLATLRRLTFAGDLYLVSVDPAVLVFLAQRIHRRQGLHLRLARDTVDLPQLVRDTLAEAGGAQQVGLIALPGATDPPTSAFLVVDADRRLSIRVRLVGSEEAPQLTLTRPDGIALDLSTTKSMDGIRMLQRTGLLQIDLDKPTDGGSWAGQWTLQASQPAVVSVWAWGGLVLHVNTQEVPAGEDAVAGSVRVVISGEAGVSLTQARVDASRVVGQLRPAAAGERVVDLRPQAVRIAHNEGDDTEHSADRLSAQVPFPPAGAGTAIADIALTIQGRDAVGQRFARLVRASMVRLEPWSAWRRRHARAGRLTFVAGRITAMRYLHGEVVGLRVHNGERARDLTVVPPVLRAALAQFDLQQLGSANLRLGVVGDQLLGVVRTYEPV